jgi:hypothetical protein
VSPVAEPLVEIPVGSVAAEDDGCLPPLRWLDVDVLPLAVSDNRRLDRPARRRLLHQPRELPPAADVFAVEFDDDVATLQACLVGGAVRLNLVDLDAARRRVSDPDAQFGAAAAEHRQFAGSGLSVDGRCQRHGDGRCAGQRDGDCRDLQSFHRINPLQATVFAGSDAGVRRKVG